MSKIENNINKQHIIKKTFLTLKIYTQALVLQKLTNYVVEGVVNFQLYYT